VKTTLVDISKLIVKKYLTEHGYEVVDEYDDMKMFLRNDGKLHHWKNSACDGWTKTDDEYVPFEAKGGCTIVLHQAIRMRDDGMLCYYQHKVKVGKPYDVEYEGNYYCVAIKTWNDVPDKTKDDIQFIEESRKKGKLLSVNCFTITWKKWA
jgi:hypothetical protein